MTTEALTKNEFQVGDFVEGVNPIGESARGCVTRIGFKWLQIDGPGKAVAVATARKVAETESPSEIAPPAVTAEVVPNDPSERLAQIEADITGGLDLMRRGKHQIWGAIAQVQREPDILTANGYSDVHDWLERRFDWKYSYRQENLKNAEQFIALLNSGVPSTDIPTSSNAMRAIDKVPESDRPSVLEQAASAGTPTAKAISEIAQPPLPVVEEFDEPTSQEAAELQVFRPDSSPDAIREGIEGGYIVPTADAPLSAEGEPILINDHIAHAGEPTSLIGRVTAFADGGRIEYVRMGKTLYIDAGVVVHQQSVAGPVNESPETNADGLQRGDLVKVGPRYRVVGRISERGAVQLLGTNPETLNDWSEAFTDPLVKVAAGDDPLGLTLEGACQSMLINLVKAFGKDLVRQTLETLEEPDA